MADDAAPLDVAPVPARPAPSGTPETYVDVVGKRREDVRTGIAAALTILVIILVIGLPLALMYGKLNSANFKDVLAGVFTPILSVFGTVTGFYYGSHASDKSNNNNNSVEL